MQVFVRNLEEIQNCYRVGTSCIMVPIFNKKVSEEPYFLYKEGQEDEIKGYLIIGNQKDLPQNKNLIESIVKTYEAKKVALIPLDESKRKKKPLS